MAVERIHECFDFHIPQDQIDTEILTDHRMNRLPGVVNGADIPPDPHLCTGKTATIRVPGFSQQLTG